MSIDVELPDRLILAALLLGEDGVNLTRFRRLAGPLGVRVEPLLALFGTLPMAKPGGGRYAHRYVDVYESMAGEALLDIADRETMVAWAWRKAVDPREPARPIRLWDSEAGM